MALHKDLSEIKDRIVERRGYEDAAKKGTQKGVEFEDACEPYIRSTAEAYSDMVESIESAAGDLGSRILYGNRSDAGAQRTKILMSIYATCEQRGVNFYQFVQDYLSGKTRTIPPGPAQNQTAIAV